MPRGSRGSRGTYAVQPPRKATNPPTRMGTDVNSFKKSDSTDALKTQMKNIPSISRSGGLDRDGFALTQSKTQNQYWEFIQEQLKALWKEYPLGSPEGKHKSERGGNILILLRKLREGILSARRVDDFARQVYEASFHLALIFKSPAHVNGIANHLIELHSSTPTTTHSSQTSRRAPLTAVLILLHELNSHYPSQSAYYTRLRSFPDSYLDRSDPMYKWLSSLRTCMHLHEFIKFGTLTQRSALKQLLPPDSAGNAQEPGGDLNLEDEVFYLLIDSLRGKVRNSAWPIIRQAYRELSLEPDVDTSKWIGRILLLESSSRRLPHISTMQWMQKRKEEGHVKEKEGRPGQWTLCR